MLYRRELYMNDTLFWDIVDSYDLVYCSDVDAHAERDEATYIDSDDTFVIDNSDFYYCDICGRWVSEWYWNSALDCCEDCEDSKRIVKPYHYHKGDYVPYGDSNKRIGAEIEVDTEDWRINREDVAREVADILGDRAFMEEDGSLSEEGFEIITHPHDFESFKELPFKKTFEMLISEGYRAHDTTTCGLHLHFSKNWFGDTEAERVQSIAKMIMFYDKNWDVLLKLSRRDDVGYCTRGYEYDAISADDILTERENVAEQLVSDKKHGSRYTAVNLTPYDRHGTVEFRLGRGTLNYKTFMAWVDIHRAICEQSRIRKNLNFACWINPDTVDANTIEYITSKVEL